MANPWDSDPVVGGNPWDADPVISAPPKKKARPNFSDVTSRVIPASGPMKLAMPTPTGREKIVPYRRGDGRLQGVIPYSPGEADRLDMESRARANDVRGESLPVRMMYGAGSAIAKNARGVGQLFGVVSPEDEARARYLEQYSAQDPAVKAGAFGAEVAMLAAPASRFAKLPAAGRYAGGGLLGAGVGYAQPIVDGESRGVNAGVGAAAGVLGQGVGDVLAYGGGRAAAAMNPKLQALYQKAKSAGIQLTPAQLSDNAFVKRLALMLDRLPGSGATSRAAKQQSAGNREIAKLLGENADSVDSAVARDAADRIGGEFDRVFESGMRYDRNFLREIAQIRKEAADQMDETAVRSINNWVERIKSQSKDGRISGRTLQSLDQAARKAATGGGDREQVARAFRESLHDAYGRQAPAESKAAWDAARRQWATLKTLEPIIAKNTDGPIPLQQLQGAITATKAGKTARARGLDGELGQLATIGQRMKGPSTSGTAENMQAAGIGAGLVTNPIVTLLTLGAGPIGSRAVNSGTLADFMMRSNAGQTRQFLSPYMRQLITGAGPTVAPYAQGKNRDKNPKKRP